MIPFLQTNDEYNQLIQSESRLIVLDFTATWCGACSVLAPELDKLQAHYQNQVLFCKVDVDDLQEVADAYQVAALPTLVFIKNKNICGQVVGAKMHSIMELIEKHM
jgi:thioredoxin 1